MGKILHGLNIWFTFTQRRRISFPPQGKTSGTWILTGRQPMNCWKRQIISTLQSVIAAKAYAAENGIALTEEQKAESKTAAEDFIAGVSPEDLEKIGIDAEGMAPLMETSFLYSLVYETIAAECEVEPEEMERYYEENREQLRAEYSF